MAIRRNIIIKSSVSTRHNPADCTYFAGSLNIFAMAFIIPFKVELDTQSDCFRLQTTKMRQTICGIIHALALLLTVICGYLKCFTFGLQPKRFEYVIYALEFSLNALFTLNLVKVLWRDQNLIERFLNSAPNRTSVVPRRKVWMAVYSCVIIFACDLSLNRTNADISHCSIFSSSSSSEKTDSPFIIRTCLTILQFLASVIIFTSQLFLYIGEALCSTVAINMWEICKNLEEKLKLDTPFKQGIEIYNEHRLTIDTVNSFSSTLFLTNLMSSLVYYAQAPILLSFGRRQQAFYCNEKAIIMMAYILITLMIWGFAGECHARTRKTIKKWVTEKQEKADGSTPAHEQFKLAAIAHNLDADPIALSCRFFNVTYGFEASMLGLLISYNIIIYQMEEQGNGIKASASVTQ